MMLPKDQPIYVICCVKDIYSAYAVATLRMGGYDAYTIPGGIPQWIELGYPYVKDATEEVIKDDRQHPQTYIPKVEIMKQVDSFIQGIPQNHSYQLHLQDVKEQQDASIIDVRLDGQDAKELVPGARKIPLPILVEAIQNNPLLISKDKSVVVVDNLDTQAAFGVLALRLMGYQAYMISSQELL